MLHSLRVHLGNCGPPLLSSSRVNLVPFPHLSDTPNSTTPAKSLIDPCVPFSHRHAYQLWIATYRSPRTIRLRTRKLTTRAPLLKSFVARSRLLRDPGSKVARTPQLGPFVAALCARSVATPPTHLRACPRSGFLAAEH